ncbi:MAG: hypothetical protein J5685_06700 [Clostridiales bacterium]|nr:hypothetical protein [Clostridiales bacterium]
MGKTTIKKKHLIAFVLIVIPVFFKVLTIPFGDLDEIWVYNISRGISMGYVPYRDFHMVFMPLFSYLFALPLMICRSLIIYRITSCIFFSVLLFVLFKNAYEESGFGFALPIAAFSLFLIDVATYNYLMFLFALLVYQTNKREPGTRRNLLLGVFAALAALSRQTSGGILIVLELIYLIIERRTKRSNPLFYLAGISIPCFLFLVCLLATGSFSSFWDDCLFALFGFSSGNSFFDIGSSGLLTVVLIGSVSDLYLIYKKAEYASNHLIVGVSALLIAVPMVDYLHVSMAAMFFLLPVMRVIKMFFKDHLKRYMSYIITSVILICIIALSVLNTAGTYTDSSIPELAGIPMNGTETGYKEIAVKNEQYRENGKNVAVFSSSSAIISIMSGRFDPPYDLFLTGNLGTNDPLSYPCALHDDPDSIVVMPDNYTEENHENPKGIYEYITENFTPVDNYGNFIYYTPDN